MHHINIQTKGFDKFQLVMDIIITDNLENLSLKDLDQKLTGPSGMGPQLYSAKNKLVEMNLGIPVYYGNCTLDGVDISEITDCEQYIIPYKQKVIQLRSAVHKSLPDQMKVFDQILSTFKFANQNQTTNATSCATNYLYFENSDFSICYPKGYTVSSQATTNEFDQFPETVVKFNNNDIAYTVAPHDWHPSGDGFTKCQPPGTAVTVSGRQASRIIYKERLGDPESNPSCGKTILIETQIDIGNIQDWFGFGVLLKNNAEPNINEYTTMEKSINIKKILN